jgi:hypothetical protein
MQLGRWYPTLIRLPDNTVLAIAGLPHGFPRIWLRKQEQYRNEDGWQLLKHRKQFPLYPRLHLLPDGKVFYSGVFNTHFQFPLSFPSALWDPKSEQQNWELYGGNHLDVNREEGISLLLALRPPDYAPRVLIAGGGSHNRGRMILGLLNAIGLRKLAAKYGENTAVDSAELMDFGGSSPVWQAEAAMHHRRIHAVGVLLPDGKVLVVGGMQSHNHYMTGEEFEDHMLSGEHGVLTPEMFDPEQHTWTMMAAQQRARLYHSTALLLPDGRVISMGSNPYAGMVEKSIEVFSPPYLFSSERPVVTGTLPESLGYGETFVLTVEKPRQVGQVVFMRPDVITHVTNTDQRLVELEFKVSGERGLEVLSPPSPNHLPNGYALLFVLNNDGVPSIGKFIRVGGS